MSYRKLTRTDIALSGTLLCAIILTVSTFVNAADTSNGKRYIVAVFPLDNLSGSSETQGLGTDIASSIMEALMKESDIAVVERDKLNKIIEELKLGASGVIDEQSAVKAGKLLGANMLLLGSFLKFNKMIKINVRLVNAETGAIANSASVKGDFDKIFELEERLVKDLTQK